MHADAAAVGDKDVTVVQRVCEVGQAGVGSRTRRVDFGRTLHGERLVWPFGVEFLDKVVEAGLLQTAAPEDETHAYARASGVRGNQAVERAARRLRRASETAPNFAFFRE